ncbi:MAG: hypothetical protein FGM52_00280 [Mycobacterium sp.]|nr:hypothetical protein [Mycobacterium sp.]
MKTITIITEQISDRALAAALPTEGVASVTVRRVHGTPRESGTETLRLRNPNRFIPIHRVEVVAEDEAVSTVLEGLSVAYGAGLFNDAEVWVDGPVLAACA